MKKTVILILVLSFILAAANAFGDPYLSRSLTETSYENILFDLEIPSIQIPGTLKFNSWPGTIGVTADSAAAEPVPEALIETESPVTGIMEPQPVPCGIAPAPGIMEPQPVVARFVFL